MSGSGLPPVRYEVIALGGGLDQVTPTLLTKPGVVRDGVNYECSITGGYSRVAGYERYDGHASPSTASATAMSVTFSAAVSLGSTVTGVTSGATGVVINTDNSRIVVTKVTGAFQDGEVLNVSGSPVATTVTVGITGTPLQLATWQALAADIYRTDIQKVPGSGPVRGVAYYNGLVYAFRDNVGGTAVDLYHSSGSGWVQDSLGKQVSFTTGGTSAPADGATLTQGGVTATVHRVVFESGSWSGSTAAGRFVISTPAGGNFAAGAATLTGGVSVTLSGAESNITLNTGGKFEIIVANFSGSLGTKRLYGCDGVNTAWEFDGSIFVPISTGMATDNPKHIIQHKNHLFLSFGTSVQHSALGNPYSYQPILGASEMAMGDDVSAFLAQPGSQQGGALAIYTLNSTNLLYGSSSSDWNLVSFNVGTGALHYSGQNMNQSYVMDDRGLMNLETTLNYGNFLQATLTHNIKPYILEKRTHISASCVNREKSQYRVFFDDGWGLYATIANGQYLGAMPVYFPNTVYCAWESEDTSGNEVSFIGDTQGYVHQLDVGTSFDGANVSAYLTLNYDAINNVRIRKRFRHASIEVQGNGYASISFGYSLGYGTSLISQTSSVNYESNFSPVYWDSFTWDSFYWDGRTLLPTECEMDGTGENVAVTLSSNGNYISPHTINTLIIHYTPRRGMR